MLQTLRGKLLFYFLLVSMSGVILISAAIHLGLHESFRNYIDLKREEQVQQVIELFTTEYQHQGKLTGDNAFMLLHQQAMTELIFYQVYDQDNQLIADSTHLIMMGGMTGSGVQLDNEDFSTTTYPIEVNGQVVGSLKVFYQQEYMDSDIHFLWNINRYIFGVAIIMIPIGIILSFFLSKKLTSGLTQMSHVARQLQKRNLKVRLEPSSQQTEEMKELAETFNDLAQSLSHQEQLRKQFTGDLAHELRTPLATLRSQLEAFLDGVWEPTAARLEQSHDELMRLVRLVDDLEKLLAAESPQIQLNIEQLEAASLLSSIGSYFTPAFLEQEKELIVQDTSEPIWFLADRDRMRQVLINLINNALKYTPPGGQVILSAYQIQQRAVFQISDTGQGISEADLPHIYERFYRGDKSRDRKTGGIGIGLSIVSALVQAQKGELHVASQLGKGTQVTISFPITDN